MVLGVHVCVSVARHVLSGLVVHGTCGGLVLELDVWLLLVVLPVVMTVRDVGLLVVHRVVMDDTGLVVMMDVLIMVGNLVVSRRIVDWHLFVNSDVLSSLNMDWLSTAMYSVFSGSVTVTNSMGKTMFSNSVTVSNSMGETMVANSVTVIGISDIM